MIKRLSFNMGMHEKPTYLLEIDKCKIGPFLTLQHHKHADWHNLFLNNPTGLANFVAVSGYGPINIEFGELISALHPQGGSDDTRVCVELLV